MIGRGKRFKRTAIMSQEIIPKKTDIGWIMEIPPDMAALLKVEAGSIAVLYPVEGELKTEILPPPFSRNERRIRAIV